jgi:hypothetical protein
MIHIKLGPVVKQFYENFQQSQLYMSSCLSTTKVVEFKEKRAILFSNKLRGGIGISTKKLLLSRMRWLSTLGKKVAEEVLRAPKGEAYIRKLGK